MASISQEFGISGVFRSPLDHFQAVCPTQQTTTLVMLGHGNDKPQWLRLRPAEAAPAIRGLQGKADVYFTPNEFRGARTLARLDALNAFYIDIDAHGENDMRNPVDMAEDALSKLRGARIPEPNILVYTGRGVHFYWSFHRTTGKALPRWRAVQQVLCSTLDGDRQAIDACRVLRMVGTSNTKAPAERSTTTGQVIRAERYDFDWLCSQILPHSREELREQRVRRHAERADRAKARQAKKQSSLSKSTSNNIFQVWYERYLDVLEIARANFGKHVPEGHRNTILFHLANALSWFTAGDALRTEIEEVAAALMPTFTRAQILATVTSVLSRSDAQVSGIQPKYKGKPSDPRYRYKTETLFFLFEQLIRNVDGLMERLRTIVSPEERKRRKTDRERQREQNRDRVAEGRYTHSKAELAALSAQRQALAKTMHQAGQAITAIANSLGVTARMVRNYLSTSSSSTAVGAAGAKNQAAEGVNTHQVSETRPEPLTAPISGIQADVQQLAQHTDPTGSDIEQSTEEMCAPSVWWPKAGLGASAPSPGEFSKISSTASAMVNPSGSPLSLQEVIYSQAVEKFKRWLAERQKTQKKKRGD